MSEKLKKNGKSFGKWIAAAALTALFIFNIGFNMDVSFEDSWIPNVEISATAQQVMAEGGSGSGEMYCKNLPSKNTGKCTETISGGITSLTCKKQDDNQDCYGQVVLIL